MNTKSKMLVAVVLFMLAGSALAVPITGDIGFFGLSSHTTSSVTILGTPTVASATGSFSSEGISAGDPVSYLPFTYNPLGPVPGIWSVDNFTFNLTQMFLANPTTPNTLDLSGVGVITNTLDGYDDTGGTWTFHADKVGSNFIWLSTTTATAAPEPGVALLLGLGLIGFVVARKFRKSA
ncbi:MAG: PEP-CTERM sorting domain-containing protein [Gammaproteobacteria bacterium]|nr:PEP-CTERM sorting domain-containing protein [Gammaproteobacteria bacterium]